MALDQQVNQSRQLMAIEKLVMKLEKEPEDIVLYFWIDSEEGLLAREVGPEGVNSGRTTEEHLRKSLKSCELKGFLNASEYATEVALE